MFEVRGFGGVGEGVDCGGVETGELVERSSCSRVCPWPGSGLVCAPATLIPADAGAALRTTAAAAAAAAAAATAVAAVTTRQRGSRLSPLDNKSCSERRVMFATPMPCDGCVYNATMGCDDRRTKVVVHVAGSRQRREGCGDSDASGGSWRRENVVEERMEREREQQEGARAAYIINALWLDGAAFAVTPGAQKGDWHGERGTRTRNEQARNPRGREEQARATTRQSQERQRAQQATARTNRPASWARAAARDSVWAPRPDDCRGSVRGTTRTWLSTCACDRVCVCACVLDKANIDSLIICVSSSTEGRTA